MQAHRFTVWMNCLGFLLIGGSLASCANKPEAYIPENQRAVLELEGSGTGNAEAITVGELLARVAGQQANSPANGPLTLGFTPGSAALPESESHRLDAAIAAWPSSSRVRLMVGSTEGGNPIAALALAQRRVAGIENRLPRNWQPAETLYRPELGADTVIIEITGMHDHARS